MRPDHIQPRILNDTEPLPADEVGRIGDEAIERYERLTRAGHPAGAALWPPVENPDTLDRAASRVAAGFEQTASARDWTVPTARVRGLAADAIGLYLEGVAYDYDREQSHAAAVLECLQGEAARAEVYQPPPELDGRTAAAPRTRAEQARKGGER